MVQIIDILPSTQTNSAKENVEIAQENYSPSGMLDFKKFLKIKKDLKNQRTIFDADASSSGKRLKANQPKNFLYSKKNLEKKREVFCFLGTINGPSYSTTKTRTVYIVSFVKMIDHYNMLNGIRVANSFINTGYSDWKHARSTGKGFHQRESSNCHQQAIQGLIEIPKSTEDVF